MKSFLCGILFFQEAYYVIAPSLLTLKFPISLFFSDKPFVGASVGYFSFLVLVAGRALTVSCIHYLSNQSQLSSLVVLLFFILFFVF